MTAKSAILDDALQLPVEDRLELAEQLLASFPGDAEAEAAWAEEVARRLRSIDAGTATMVSWDEARKRLRE